MKEKGTKNLSYTQRLILESCLKAGLHKKEIAKKMGVCLATVYNEIKRGEYKHKTYQYTDFWGDAHYKNVTRYSPNIAEDKYWLNQTSKGVPLKIGNDYDFVAYVEKRVLKDKISPCAVLGEIKRKNLFKTNISKTTLYRYIEKGIFMNITIEDLPMKKRKKRYRKAIAKRPPRGVSIEQRPKVVSDRKDFGHWEMDCVCGSTNASLLVLTERLTRKELIFPIPAQKVDCVVKCLNVLERKFGSLFRKVFKSITVDNGSEFSDSKRLELSRYGGRRTSVFYCHPYSSFERGTNERMNREIRRHIPKGSNLSKFSIDEIIAIEKWVNDYPRGIFDFATSDEMFEHQLSLL